MSKRLTLIFDQERCIGCDACTVACRIENDCKKGFINVLTQDSLQKDVAIGTFPDLSLVFLPRICQHCENAPCLSSCPSEAISRRDDGIVFLDEEACDGCKSCIHACPYEALSFNEKNNTSSKCNLCAHRIDDGLLPFCVVCCEGQAIIFGDLNDPESEVSKIKLTSATFRLKEDLNTEPSVYYKPPMEKREL